MGDAARVHAVAQRADVGDGVRTEEPGAEKIVDRPHRSLVSDPAVVGATGGRVQTVPTGGLEHRDPVETRRRDVGVVEPPVPVGHVEELTERVYEDLLVRVALGLDHVGLGHRVEGVTIELDDVGPEVLA